MQSQKTVGAGPGACPFRSSAGPSGRTQGFACTTKPSFLQRFCIDTAHLTHTGALTAFLLILLLAVLPLSASADQITAPLADPAQQSAQKPDTGQQNTLTPQQQATQQTSLGENQFYDIREPIPIPDNTRFFWWLAAILAALLLLGLLFYFLKKRTRKQRAVLAHETALRELERAAPLIEEQNINAFITLIDQALRRYIEQRFHIFARRQTTREFIHELTEDQEKVPQDLMDNSENLTTWLQHCDLVKFAKAGLNRETMIDMVDNLRTFIESTKLEAEEK
ncbi:MAG: hypothetical protein Q3M24_13505 [Candidatus Electrothrix aestuarii]|uniref:LPXTG-motif cell wall anchor domain-containing protein n=1 Tax=Candidatus Electrothrix aestuarii TaxID=3062594 RepID=A0AAU8LQ40_9BACT|nr:hypothetical protein [Candidatus Electrothrix aestuarii]